MALYISVGVNGVSNVFSIDGGFSTRISFARARMHSKSTSLLSYLVRRKFVKAVAIPVWDVWMMPFPSRTLLTIRVGIAWVAPQEDCRLLRCQTSLS